MKKTELRKMIGRTVKVRPPVLARLDDGTRIQAPDREWLVESPMKRWAVVSIRNLATGHVWDLGSENVYKFEAPNIIVLKGQLTIDGRSLEWEILPDPRERYR
jgi:hypothetical protein